MSLIRTSRSQKKAPESVKTAILPIVADGYLAAHGKNRPKDICSMIVAREGLDQTEVMNFRDLQRHIAGYILKLNKQYK